MNGNMGLTGLSTGNIAKSLVTGDWKPNLYLTNLSVAQFAEPDDYVAYKVFPIVPVQLPTSNYYVFNKGDLARSTMTEKPQYGKVDPALWGHTDDSYSVKVYQGIWGIDQISALTYQRSGAPGMADPRTAKARVAAEQSKLLMDVKFAEKYFKAGVWTNEFAGVATTPTGKQFWQFDNDNCNPIEFFQMLLTRMKLQGRRVPNKLCLGAYTYLGLINNKYIIERVKYGGSTPNPAAVTLNVLAQLLGFKEVMVMQSTYNTAAMGQTTNMEFVCDPKGALLVYTPDGPAIDEPSAGYIFTWDMLGNGSTMAITNYLGEAGTHTEFVEALCSFDMKQVSVDLATYMTNCVSDAVVPPAA